MSRTPAIICDIDGTLAHMTGRSPYDPTRYSEDEVDPFIRDLFQQMTERGETKIIVSGRSDEYREVTEKWLRDNGIFYDLLFMRDPKRVDERGQKVNDAIIKREIYEQFIKDEFDVLCILDDRNRVVDMWRNELGLRCLQVAEGNF